MRRARECLLVLVVVVGALSFAAPSDAADTRAPRTTITRAPASLVATRTATFRFAADERGATFRCSRDGARYRRCSSPIRYTSLRDGRHVFRVYAVDRAGNRDRTPAARAVTVDTRAPQTTITAGPVAGSTVASDAAALTLAASERGARFRCRLDAGAFAGCTSTPTLAGLSEGQHTFRAVACDRAGNCDPTPATRSWTVDTTPPTIDITDGPSGSSAAATQAFAFIVEGDVVSTRCELDGGGLVDCTSPYTVSSPPLGAHTVHVRVCDAVANCADASRSWTQTAPVANNETDAAAEADFCILKFPANAETVQGDPVPVFGQVYEAGVTESAGGNVQVIAEVGFGPIGSDPRTSSAWQWTPATFNTQDMSNDEYAGSIVVDVPGVHAYTVRYSLDDGASYTYGDLNGAGSGPGLTFETAQLGTLTVIERR